jgi:hypothetical protein
MKYYLIVCLVTVAGLPTTCTNQNRSMADKSTWIKYEVDDKWIFSAPKGAKIIYVRGMDSVPGNIILQNDSINLAFDSGFEGFPDIVCDLNTELERARAEVARGSYKYLDRPDTLHTAQVYAINGMAATIITPIRVGGVTDLFIANCERHCGLGIYGKNLSLAKQEVVLEIFKSIQCKASK